MKFIKTFARRERDERGATALVAGLMSLVLLGIAAFTVDIGMQRVARRDMQSLADVVALDLARELGERSVADFTTQTPTIQTLADQSRARNGGTLGETPTLTPELGYVNTVGEFVPMSGDQVPTAVRVAASTTVDFAFGLATSGGATRSAVGQQTEDSACFEIGSYAAALALGDSVLGPFADLLGLDTDLTLASYEALAGVDLSLADIALSPSIGSPDALLDPSGVRVGDLLDATIYALQHDKENGDTETALALQALQLIRNESGLDLDGTVVVPDVVSVDAGDTASLSTNLNVLELVGASLALANGENFLASQVPVDLTALGLGNGSISVSAIQGPRYTCGHPWATPDDDCQVIRDGGGACARQSQVNVGLTLNESTQTVRLPPALDVLATGSISTTVGPVVVSGGVGNAKGVLLSVDNCGPPDQITVNVGTGLLRLNLSAFVGIGGSLSLNVGSVLPGPLETLVGNVLNLPGLLGAIFGGYGYEYRNFRLKFDLEQAGVNLSAVSQGTTSTEDVPLESPTNDRSGEPVRVPDPPAPLALGDLAVPGNLLSGKVKVTLEYQWRSARFVAGIRTGPWSDWTNSSDAAPPGTLPSEPLISGDLSDLATLGAPFNLLGTVLQDTLDGVVNTLNTQIVDVVNGVLLDDTLLPLLGLSGTGADLYSVSRPLCGGPPKLVG